MTSIGRWTGIRSALAAGGASVLAAPALAGSGQPSPKQMTFQEAVTPIAEQIHWFHDFVNVIIFLITGFVLALMLYVIWRFNEKRNPVPTKTTHNTTLEVLWTVVPVLVLVIIAIPSFKLLYAQYTYPPPDLTIKVTGHAWNWTHEYPDQKISVDSVMLQDDEREALIKSGMPATLPSTTRSSFRSTRWCTFWSRHRTSSTRGPFRPSVPRWTRFPVA
jgi:cytochrome c oxidase subunit 2